MGSSLPGLVLAGGPYSQKLPYADGFGLCVSRGVKASYMGMGTVPEKRQCRFCIGTLLPTVAATENVSFEAC